MLELRLGDQGCAAQQPPTSVEQREKRKKGLHVHSPHPQCRSCTEKDGPSQGPSCPPPVHGETHLQKQQNNHDNGSYKQTRDGHQDNAKVKERRIKENDKNFSQV